MEKTLDPEEEKIGRLMKILESMHLNSNGPNITKEELIKMRNEMKNKKNEVKSI